MKARTFLWQDPVVDQEAVASEAEVAEAALAEVAVAASEEAATEVALAEDREDLTDLHTDITDRSSEAGIIAPTITAAVASAVLLV